MKILFIGHKPTQNFFRVGVIGNNLADMIKMVIKAEQGDINLKDYTAYLKISNKDKTYMNKTKKLTIEDESESEAITYTVPQEVTELGSVDMQLSFEKEEADNLVIWQTSIFNITFDNQINISEYVNKYYPDILTEFEERLAKVEKEVEESQITTVATKGNLPNIGVDGAIYIVKDENVIYRFDADSNIYVAIGTNYENIKIIDCNAN